MASEIFVGDAAFWAAVGLLAGILAANLGWNLLEVVAWSLLGALGFAALDAKRLSPSKTHFVFGGIYLAAFFCGAFYYHFFVAFSAARINLPIGKTISFSAIVSDEPKPSAKSLLLSAQIEKPYSGAITIFAPLGSGFRYGDEISMQAAITPPEFAGDDPAVFPKKIKFVAAHRGFWLREKLLDFKAAILEKFNDVLPSDTAALLGGETLGGMDGMSADLKNKMSASGTSYITAMYGYKIAVIAMIVMDGLASWVARRARFFLALLAVALFAVMAGGGASVVRGAIMAALVLVANEAGRVYNARNALTLTAAGMALLDPTVVTQAAFLLSFLSLLGIMYLTKPLKRVFRFREEGNGDEGGTGGIIDWREAIVIAVASLLPIIPVIANAFGDFSLTAFPSNILVFPAVPAAMGLGIALACAGFISHYLALLIAPVVNVVLLCQLVVIDVFAALPAPLPIAFDSVFSFAAYYLALGFFAYRYA